MLKEVGKAIEPTASFLDPEHVLPLVYIPTRNHNLMTTATADYLPSPMTLPGRRFFDKQKNLAGRDRRAKGEILTSLIAPI